MGHTLGHGCMICYKNYCDNLNDSGINNPDLHSKLLSEDERKLVKRFIKFLERYLEKIQKNYDDSPRVRKLDKIESIIESGTVGVCKDCFEIVDAFCTLYHDLKTIELLLNWKLLTLKEIIQQAHQDISRVEQFKLAIRKIAVVTNEEKDVHSEPNVFETFEVIENYNNNLTKDCEQMILYSSVPNIRIQKCKNEIKPKPSSNSDSLQISPHQSSVSSDMECDDEAMMVSNTKPPSPNGNEDVTCVQKRATISLDQTVDPANNDKMSNERNSIHCTCTICTQTFPDHRLLLTHANDAHQNIQNRVTKGIPASSSSASLGPVAKIAFRKPPVISPATVTSQTKPKPNTVKISVVVNRNRKSSSSSASTSDSIGMNTLDYTQNRTMVCEICNQSFGNLCRLNEHQERAHQGMRVKCIACKKRFKCHRYLENHQIESKECHQQPEDNSAEITHSNNGESNLNYQCTYCKKRFRNIFDWKLHIGIFHEDK